MLREVTDLPTLNGRGRKSYVERDAIDFARSDMAIAEISYEGKTWSNVYMAARHWVRRHRDQCPGVIVAHRGEHVYLVKEVAE